MPKRSTPPAKLSRKKVVQRSDASTVSLNKEERQMAETNSKGNGSPEAKAAEPATAAAPERQPATIRYVDRADMPETFADSITGLMFDGQTLRVEFGVTRFDEVKPNTQITGRRYPACRLVLPPAAAVELINRIQQVAAALAQAGVFKATPRPAATETAKS